MQHVTNTSSTNKMPTSPTNTRKHSPFPKLSRPIPASWADDIDSPVEQRRHHNAFGVPQGVPSKLQNGSLLNPDSNATSDAAAQSENARWKVNGAGQLVHSDAAAAFLADDMARLKVNSGANDVDPSVNGAPGVKLQEASPLETSADPAAAKSGTPPSDQHLGLPNHNRSDSTSSQTSNGPGSSHRDRPHSYSGGISTADLRRLQVIPEPDQARAGSGGQEQQGQPEQTTFPSLASQPRQQPGSPDLQVDYGVQQRQYQPITIDTRVQGQNAHNYRSPALQQRAFNGQQGAAQPNGGANASYPMPPGVANNAQAAAFENPAIARVQQQQQGFRNNHQHSSSDPVHMRDAAAAALVSGGMPFTPGLYPLATGPGVYPGAFFAPQEAYAPGVAQIMAAARMQQGFGQPFGMGMPMLQQQQTGGSAGSQSGLAVDPTGNGPSANNRKLGLYKTELCRSWEEKGSCRYGPKCQFAHGEDEIRKVSRHPKYKTEICRTFWVSGSCPYGKRCCFIHTELPASGAPPGADGAPPPKITQPQDNRPRSDSESTEGQQQQISRLQRLQNHPQDPSPPTSAGDTTPSTAYPTPTNSMPPRQSLRLDTTSLDQPALSKTQNKSAYPAFAPNAGAMFRKDENTGSRSPGPVTAGPDLGRQRMEFPGFSNQGNANKRSSGSSVRHSFNGTEVINLGLKSPTPPSGSSSPFATPAPDLTPPRAVGHARSGSAGNWSTLARSVAFPGPQTAAPINEQRANVPWLSAVDGPGTAARW
ncbi:hypothetical protein PENSPDRAFT_596642 [Peniophora sp. CONT]|nr:hypothetical protein PENSPDRAFT_596642 [Peniophora sp. CONT]